MQIVGKTPEAIVAQVVKQYPEWPAVLERVNARVPYYKRAIAPYQGAALYQITKQYTAHTYPKILEIGTAWGFSAAIMAEAAPRAEIDTLNPKKSEWKEARKNLTPYGVHVYNCKSWDFWDHPAAASMRYDLIFVDGDHGRVIKDLIWFNRLRHGGLILFHDYSPPGAGRPCHPVYHTLNAWAMHMGHSPDVRVIDDQGVGMAGWKRLEAQQYDGGLDEAAHTWSFDAQSRVWVAPEDHRV